MTKLWLYGLTADEWLHLAAEDDESEVAPCCAIISFLRECLNALATSQASGGWQIFHSGQVLEAYEAAVESHEKLADPAEFPLLHRVLAGIQGES